MIKFSDSNEYIYAVWDPENLHKWDELNQYDAAPDGLSGKKEGFYFADHLIPFIVPFMVAGAVISPENHPPCIRCGPKRLSDVFLLHARQLPFVKRY